MQDNRIGGTSRDEMLVELEKLRKEHRELDTRISRMTAMPYLTAEDQVEVARLKKLKLAKKDEILTMAQKLGVEM